MEVNSVRQLYVCTYIALGCLLGAYDCVSFKLMILKFVHPILLCVGIKSVHY